MNTQVMYRETPHSTETCGCFAPSCNRGSGGIRCEQPATIEARDPFGTGWDVCASCWSSHFVGWAAR